MAFAAFVGFAGLTVASSSSMRFCYGRLARPSSHAPAGDGLPEPGTSATGGWLDRGFSEGDRVGLGDQAILGSRAAALLPPSNATTNTAAPQTLTVVSTDGIHVPTLAGPSSTKILL